MDAVEQLRAHEAECAKRHEEVSARFEDVSARFEDVSARFEDVSARFEDVSVRLAKLETAMAYHGKMLWAVLGVAIVSLAKDAIAPLVG